MNELMLPILAQVSGESAMHLVFYLIIIGLCFWLLWWLIGYVGLPAPFDKVARVILAVLAVFFLINCLMSITGHPLVKF
jgi:hypothetical protein